MGNSITLSEEEYRSLVLVLNIGEAVISGEEGSEDAGELVRFIYSHAEKFNCTDLIAKKMGNSVPTEKLDEEARVALDNYHESVLEFYLADRLAKRDFEKLNSGTLSKMTEEEKDSGTQILKEKYIDEFQANGLQNLKW